MHFLWFFHSAIRSLVPYNDDYFDLHVRTQTRRDPNRKYGIKHMIYPQPPFKRDFMKLYVSYVPYYDNNYVHWLCLNILQIYKNGVVSFGKKLGNNYPRITAMGNLSFENAEMCFFVNPSKLQFAKRRDHIMDLLKYNKTKGVEEFDLKNMMIITWSNVILKTCNQVKLTHHIFLKSNTSPDIIPHMHTHTHTHTHTHYS